MRPLNIALFADDRHNALAVSDHVQAFRQCSRHNWFVLNPMRDVFCWYVNLNRFDAVAIHYSLCVIFDHFLPQQLREHIAKYKGPKLQFIQDEYRWVNRISERIAELGISTLFTLVRPDLVEQAYSNPKLKGVRKVSVLPGYVPEHLRKFETVPIGRRSLHLVYRSRPLPYWLGRLGQEKLRIAEGVASRAAAYGLAIDVSAREEDRIYGTAWLDFLSSGKAALGTEGGASIWDFEGKAEQGVNDYLREYPEASFEEVFDAVLRPFEGNLMYNTISPRLFEAIALRTPLVMFPGWYNGIVEPERHYIPLEKDFSNFADVAKRLKDDRYLQDLADRAHDEIISSGRYTKRAFLNLVDTEVERAVVSLAASSAAVVRTGESAPVPRNHHALRYHIAISRSLFNYRVSADRLRISLALKGGQLGARMILLRQVIWLRELGRILTDSELPLGDRVDEVAKRIYVALRLYKIAWVHKGLRHIYRSMRGDDSRHTHSEHAPGDAEGRPRVPRVTDKHDSFRI